MVPFRVCCVVTMSYCIGLPNRLSIPTAKWKRQKNGDSREIRKKSDKKLVASTDEQGCFAVMTRMISMKEAHSVRSEKSIHIKTCALG